MDAIRGIVTTKGTFDRETKDIYTIPIYVIEATSPVSDQPNKKLNSQFDVATLVVKITDVNDHAPEFRPGSCYPLAVPENNDLAIIHTIVASDLDEGPNGDIIYSITGICFIETGHNHGKIINNFFFKLKVVMWEINSVLICTLVS